MSFKSMSLVAVGVCALAIPASVASAQGGSGDSSESAIPHGADYSSVNATGGSGDSSESTIRHGAYYSSVNAITGNSDDASDSGGGVAAGLAHRTPTELGQSTRGSPDALVLRRDGSKAEPFVAYVGASPPTASDDGFDLGSAAVGAGVAMAMIALGGAALIITRRYAARSVSATTS
jgi:hypothetical protein